MSYDDNLITSKRKNRNPIHTTNLLIIAGFVATIVLFILFMNDNDTPAYTNAEIEATVDARLSEYIARQPTTIPAQTTTDINEIPDPTSIPPTLEPRLIIEGQELIAGGVVSEQITDDTFEIHYTFAGTADTPIIITMQGVGLEEPAVILTNPYGNRIVASATANQPIGDEDTHVIGAILPIDGQYVITATRQNGRAGDAEGDFELTLDIPESLNAESRVNGVATGDTWQWYIVENDDSFSINYTQQSDSFYPEVGVYRLTARSAFDGIAYLIGNELTYGTLGRFDADTTYFVAIGQPTLHDFKPISGASEYTLGIQIAK